MECNFRFIDALFLIVNVVSLENSCFRDIEHQNVQKMINGCNVVNDDRNLVLG